MTSLSSNCNFGPQRQLVCSAQDKSLLLDLTESSKKEDCMVVVLCIVSGS